ncbi:MAG: DUF3572 domain-containing protein [Filomicrobium sp.]
MPSRRNSQLSDADAELIGLKALGFVAEDGDRLERFLALSGVDVRALRAQASDPQTLAGILAHLLQDESLLLSFAANQQLQPEEISAAHRLLSGAHESSDWP